VLNGQCYICPNGGTYDGAKCTGGGGGSTKKFGRQTRTLN
jgi:hypothetical protein